MKTHPLAIVSLTSSLLAYASAFIGSPALVMPAIGVAVIAVLCGFFARRAIAARPEAFTGGAFAIVGMLSGAAFVLLGSMLLRVSGVPG